MTVSGRGRAPKSTSLRFSVIFVVVSQLAVLKYLYHQLPSLNHPWKPPVAVSRGGYSNTGDADGLFNGIPITYRSQRNPPSSSVQCIGENFESNAWMFRSCRYQNVCFDWTAKEIVYYQSFREVELINAIQASGKQQKFMTVSTVQNPDTLVSLSAIRPEMSPEQEKQIQWKPKVVPYEQISSTGFYELPSDVVVVVVLGSGGENKNWIWNQLFPVYTLLSIFGLTNHPSLMRPLLMLPNDNLPLTKEYQSLLGYPNDFSFTNQFPKSNLICARQAVAGMGMIADRGHGLPSRWKPDTRQSKLWATHPFQANLFTHNLAQGRMLQGYRDYMLRNLQVEGGGLDRNQLQITWYGVEATQSLQAEIASFRPNTKFHQLNAWTSETLAETARVIAQSSVLIVQCCASDAALAATFLPSGASLFVYYMGGGANPSRDFPVWNLMDNAGYIQTRWLPAGQDALVARSIRQDFGT